MKRSNLFHNASLRLSVTYLLILLGISISFSLIVFQVSSDEIERTINKPFDQNERRQLASEGREALDELAAERVEEIDESKQRLFNQLILINMFILAAGGPGSYLLARRSLQPIEAAHEAQSRFTADASHELRTPITAMRAETELTLTEPKLTLAHAKKQLQSNVEELDKLTALSEGLLQLARMDTHSLERNKVSLDHIIAQVAERVEKRLKPKHQKLQLPDANDVMLYVHQSSIVEALVTIVDNASKYSPDKSTIVIGIKTTKYTAKITITDSGIGIKASDLQHIFDRFYRADASRSSAASTHGYGIGLSIAKQAVEANNGSISAQSEPKKGSTFTIALPRA